MPVPIVRIFPLKETDLQKALISIKFEINLILKSHLIPQPLFLDGIFLMACKVLASNRSVLALEPTAYMVASSSVDKQTFSML